MRTLICEFRQLSPGVTLPAWVSEGAAGLDSLQDYFKNGSNNQIQLLVDASNATTPIYSDSLPLVESYYLHCALYEMFRSNDIRHTDGTVDKVRLLLCGAYQPKPEIFGVMFDTGFDTEFDHFYSQQPSIVSPPRQGCAIFLNSIYQARGKLAWESQAFFTSIHELGHIFNLGHIETQPNFMHSSSSSGTFMPLGDSDYYQFVQPHKQLLEKSPNSPSIWPGGSKFDPTINPYDGITEPFNENQKSRFGLQIKLDMARRSFQYYDPVELDIELSVVPGISKSFRVPDAVDPGYEIFRLWIEEPTGERRLYRSPRHYCWNGRHLTIAPGKSFNRDISIFGESGGYTFKRKGIYRILAEFSISRKYIIRSTPLEFEIQPVSMSTDSMQRQAVFTSRTSKRLFYYRATPNDESLLEQLISYFNQFPKDSASASFWYNLSRAYAKRLEINSINRDKALAQKIREFLLRAIDDRVLGIHQRLLARQLSETLKSL